MKLYLDGAVNRLNVEHRIRSFFFDQTGRFIAGGWAEL
jgi:hypothetical protein